MLTEQGFVKTVNPRREFGFIGSNGRDIYFHAADLAREIEFNESLRGRVVRFDLIDSPRGPRAMAVRPV